jgi:hypothetical protein
MALSKLRAILVGSTVGVFILVAIAGIWILRFENQARAPIALAARTARGSAEVRQLLGEPIHISFAAKGNLVSKRGYGNADLIIQVDGRLGQGTLLEWAQEDTGKWQICSLLFRSASGSTIIPLVDDSITHCERE